MERRRLHMNSPMADSTRIDASPIGNRSVLPASFLMGLSPLSRRNSMINGGGSRTPEKSLANQTATTATAGSTSISRQKLNLSQLDPRTFADVHSHGLASRIVAYHDSSLGGRGGGGGLQRSMSASNLYNPLSHPRRPAAPPLPYKSSVPVLSLTQIAPPERSFYSGNTLSSLMRSNSLVGVVHNKPSDQEQLSRENRPILHPPHPQHECEPTRSVLEELKEISRKRINSGDTQSAHDFTKRSCQREDFVDLHQHQHQHHQHHHHHQHQHELQRLHQQQQQQQQQHQSFKRQRELTVAVPLRHNLTSLPAPPPPTLQHMYSNGTVSPEQVAKRRNCSYTNDIASSLSSSRRHSNKRKLFDMRESLQRSHNDTAASTSSPENSPESKVQRKVDTEFIGRTQSMPIPVVPAVPPARTISAPPVKSSKEIPPPAVEKPKLTLFNARQPPATTAADQPRQDLASPDVDAGEYAGIQFVKPKRHSSALGARNPSVERTQKTKLAIMLSGLKGELYQGEPEPDEPDATLPPPPPATLPTPIKPIVASVVATTTTTTTTTTTVSSEAKTIVSPSKPVILSNQVIVPAKAASPTAAVPKLTFGQPAGGAASAPAPASASTSDKAPPAALGTLPKFNLPTAKPAASLAPVSTSAQPLLTFGSPKSSTAPTLSFGTTTPSTTTTTSSSSSTSSSSTAPVFSFGQAPGTNGGGAALAFNTETSNTTSAATTKPDTAPPLAFGISSAPPAKTIATILPSTSTAAPVLSFGQPKAAIQSTGSTTTTAATTATISPFGSGSATAASSSSSSMVSPPKATPMFAFGQSGAGASSAKSTPAEPAVFSFGSSNGAAASKPMGNSFGGVFNAPVAVTKPEPAKPAAGIFGSQDNTFGSPFKPPAAGAGAPALATEPANSFAFKAPATSAAAAPPAAATNLFTFGAGSATAKPAEPAAPASFAAAATPFSFGGAGAKETGSNTDTKSVFAFGGGGGGGAAGGAGAAGTDQSKPSGVFNFGGGDKAAPPPAFGSVATSTSTPTPTGNAFGFGSAQKLATPMFGSGTVAGATAAAATKPFAFGGTQQTQPAPTPTAAPAPAGGGFSFAAAKKTEEPNGAGNLFGSPAAKPSFNFGGNTSIQATAGAGAPGAGGGGGFSFSATKKNEPAATNVFGSPASSNTGVVKPTFAFGGGSNPTPQTSANAPSSGFGGFGAPAAAAAAAAAAPAAASNPNKPFAFGASAASAPGSNLFASAVAATQNQAKPGGFAFGGAKSATTNNSTAAGNAPFAFGGAAAGGIASPPSNQSMNTAKPFSFGGAGGNPAPNMFGSPAPTPAASNPAGAFGFGQASPAQQANAGNMFVPPPSTPENRPIRKATRRLQK